MDAAAATALVAGIVPRSITPPQRPHGFFGAVATLVDNPIKIWPEQLYREPYLIAGARRRFVHIAAPDLAEGVLIDHADAFVRARLGSRLLKPGLGEGLLTVEGEVWRRQRRIAAPAFRVAALRALTPVMAAAGRAAAERLAARSVSAAGASGALVDVMPEMTRTTYEVVLETLLRLRGEGFDADAMAEDVDTYIETMGRPDLFDVFNAPTWAPRPWKRRGRRAADRLRAAALDAVRAAAAGRRGSAHGAAATLTELLTAAADPETGGRMTERELVDNVITFIAAGHETTALALTWSLYLIAQAPALQDALAAEAAAVLDGDPVSGPVSAPVVAEQVDRLTLHAQVIDEAMRLYPPAALLGRSATRAVTLMGADGPLEIRVGDEVAVATYVMHRHRALWEAPDAFRLGRKPVHRCAYLPFGAGPRVCIGLRFATLEAAAILAELTRRIRFAPGPERPIEPVMRITLRPKGGMPLRVAAR